jgi:hypothetical protein
VARFAVLLAIAAAWPLAVDAYRPFDSTDAAVAPEGDVEIELGPVGVLAQGSDLALVAPSLVVNWGFADRWEAVLEGRNLVEVGGSAARPPLRIDGMALSVKTVLREGSLQAGSGPSVATELGALLPDVHGEAGLGAAWALAVSQRWRELTVHLNCAAAWSRAHQPALLAGAILEGHDTWALRPVAEVTVGRERGSATALSGLLGAV